MKHTIIVDTREKQPWMFLKYGHEVRVGTLKTGDYSLAGHSLAIERKSLADLYGSMTAGRLRFYNELRRLGDLGFAALVVEADEMIVEMGSGRTSVSPGRMLRTLYAWCCAFRIQLHFCANRAEAERKAYRLMAGWAASRDLKSL